MTIVIMNRDACAKAIKSIGRFAGKLQVRIHTVAVSTLDHIREHGDTTLAASLLNALPKGQRVEALAFWYKHFSSGKAVFAKDKTSGSWTCSLAKDRMEFDFKIGEAALTSFAELTKEAAPGKTFTVEALIKMLKSKADEDGSYENGTPKVDEAARDLASALLASIDQRPKLRIVARDVAGTEQAEQAAA
jgi:hypothetical protein